MPYPNIKRKDRDKTYNQIQAISSNPKNGINIRHIIKYQVSQASTQKVCKTYFKPKCGVDIKSTIREEGSNYMFMMSL